MIFARAWRWAWSQPWLVLLYMAIWFGANGVAARLATGQVPPLFLVFLRWFFVCAVLAAMFNKEQWRELRAIVRSHWRRLAWMGLLGYTGFNALFYVAAYSTSAVNLTLLQSAIPALVLAGAGVIYKIRIRALQISGMAMTFLGVVIVAMHGDLARLSAFRLDRGDALVLIACVFYAAYTLGLRARPSGTPLVFFAGMAAAALLWSLPIAGAEIALHRFYWPSPQGWMITVLIAFGPSLTGQLAYMRGVDLIGPARAGLFANLIPIFGALCAVGILHEAFTLAHAAALVLGLAGIALAEWRAPVRRTPALEHAEAASDAGLPQADERRDHQFHDRAEDHGLPGHDHEDDADQSEEPAEKDDRGQQAHPVGAPLDLRDRFPERQPNAEQKAGQVANHTVERRILGASARHRRAQKSAP